MITPDMMVSYLEHLQWKNLGEAKGRYTLWSPGDGSDLEVTIPVRTDFDDYQEAIDRVVSSVADHMGRGKEWVVGALYGVQRV